MLNLRTLNWPVDRDALLALDTSFTTDRICRIAITEGSFALEEERVAPLLRKVFDLGDDVESLPDLDSVVVAEVEGRIVGLLALKHETWNRRAVIWHLYVDPSVRGQGIGRALIEEAIQTAQRWSARCLWLETQNINHGAIQFYRRLGFQWCGLDTTLYDPAGEAAGEIALFFARPLS
jgi:ribosomal protein S18 acetylase RimI-like enzyme